MPCPRGDPAGCHVILLRRHSERGELDVEDPATAARQFVSRLVLVRAYRPDAKPS
ncbi:TetR/AcrR family transcriptional regulator C-terminal domain-containing protein [Nocardia fluminea]